MATLTSWLDKLTKDPAKSEIYGTELLAKIIQLPADWKFTRLGAKLWKILWGVIFAGTASKAGGTGTRLGRELHEMSAEMIFDAIFDPTPEDIEMLKRDLEAIKKAIALGSPKDILKALVRTPTPTLKPATAPTKAEVKKEIEVKKEYVLPLRGR